MIFLLLIPYFIIAFYVSRFLAFYFNERSIKLERGRYGSNRCLYWHEMPSWWFGTVLGGLFWLPTVILYFPIKGAIKFTQKADEKLIYLAKEVIDPKNNVKEIS